VIPHNGTVLAFLRIVPTKPTSRNKRIGGGVAIFCVALALCGCGFTAGSSVGPPPNVTVSVSPPSASVSLGQTAQFMATVTGAGSSAVNWSVDNVAGGNSDVGTISTSGQYTAPQMMPSTSSVTVTATSQVAPQASGSAAVQIQSDIVVSIAPNSASMSPGGIANFTATVTGAGTGSSAVIRVLIIQSIVSQGSLAYTRDYMVPAAGGCPVAQQQNIAVGPPPLVRQWSTSLPNINPPVIVTVAPAGPNSN
jgi:hypothetical protein